MTAKTPKGPPQKEIVDARGDEEGDTTHVLFKGNANFTPVEVAIPIAERGGIKNAHVVHPNDGRKVHLRTNADGRKDNNLDDMIGDT